MTSLLLAAAAALGVHLLVGPSHRSRRTGHARAVAAGRQLLARHGHPTLPLLFAVAAGAAGSVVVGPGPSTVVAAIGAAAVPVTLRRRTERRRKEVAATAWPRMVEELRIHTGTLGRSVPQALMDVGLRAPDELRPAFAAAQREWALTADFASTVAVLTEMLDDPTADAACETLLVAHEVGGDLDRRLADLAEDRRRDLQERRAADAAMAGARLARAFVVVVPVGMLLAGLGVGDGAAAYRTADGQLLLGGAAAMVGVCWWWAGTLMRVPGERRVFVR